MAHKLDPMDLKQILNLHLDGFSNRKIASTLGIGRNSINRYMALFKACEHDLVVLKDLDSAELDALFPLHSTIDNKRFNALMLYFEKVNKARSHPGFTFLYHYVEYEQTHADPYSYTQFMEHYNRRYTKIRGSMKLEHTAGHEMLIDFAGKKLHVVDKTTGELIPVEVYVAILPCSQYTYVEACYSQKRLDFISCTAHALSFFGGVPKAIVPDNLKSAVTRSSKYEPAINRSFKDFAAHYNCVINPTRSYAPQDKALVENAVNLAYQRIYHPMRNMTFFSLEELNAEIRKHLEAYNNQLFKRKNASRKELFQSIERQYLNPLPITSYEYKEYRRAKVQKIGYVYFSTDKTYYSVPYNYIGKYTLIHYTKSLIEVYHNNERIAIHPRNPSKGIYNTKKEHLSSSHQAYTDWSPDYFKKRAIKHGENTLNYVARMLDAGNYPETNYKRILGLIQLHRAYTSARLNAACGIALQTDGTSYKFVKNILQNKMDIERTDTLKLNNTQTHIPLHENTRGAKKYK